MGRSHFAQIGQEYKGVKVSDATHLVLYGRRLEITAQSNWNFIDRCLQAHFADEPFTVTRANVLNLSTPDEKFLLSTIHRETVEEAAQPRQQALHRPRLVRRTAVTRRFIACDFAIIPT